MDGLYISIGATIALIISWSAGYWSNTIIGLTVLLLEVAGVLFLFALLIGVYFNIVSL